MADHPVAQPPLPQQNSDDSVSSTSTSASTLVGSATIDDAGCNPAKDRSSLAGREVEPTAADSLASPLDSSTADPLRENAGSTAAGAESPDPAAGQLPPFDEIDEPSLRFARQRTQSSTESLARSLLAMLSGTDNAGSLEVIRSNRRINVTLTTFQILLITIPCMYGILVLVFQILAYISAEKQSSVPNSPTMQAPISSTVSLSDDSISKLVEGVVDGLHEVVKTCSGNEVRNMIHQRTTRFMMLIQRYIYRATIPGLHASERPSRRLLDCPTFIQATIIQNGYSSAKSTSSLRPFLKSVIIEPLPLTMITR